LLEVAPAKLLSRLDRSSARARICSHRGTFAPAPKFEILNRPHAVQGTLERLPELEIDRKGTLVTVSPNLEAIVSIVHNLHRGGPSAVRDLRKFTSALEDMCETYMSRDRKGFEDAASDARDALEGLIGE